MTQAAAFGTNQRNALLECLVGYITSMYGAGSGNFSSSYSTLQLYSSPFGDTSAPMGNVSVNGGNSAQWGAAIAGTAPFNMSWHSNMFTANVVWARWTLYSNNNVGPSGVVDGLVTLPGGGGMLIIPALSIPTSSVVALSGTLIMPLNNGGTLRLNQALANNLLNTLIYDTNAPSMFSAGGAQLQFYTGTQPATADTAITTQTQLSASQYVPSPARFASASGGIIALAAALGTTNYATANGTAAWFRLINGANVMDGSAGVTGSGADAILASTAFSPGLNCPTLNSLTLTSP